MPPIFGGELPETKLGILFSACFSYIVSHRLVTFDEGDGDAFALVGPHDAADLDGVGHVRSPLGCWLVGTLILRQKVADILNILKIIFLICRHRLGTMTLSRYNDSK